MKVSIKMRFLIICLFLSYSVNVLLRVGKPPSLNSVDRICASMECKTTQDLQGTLVIISECPAANHNVINTKTNSDWLNVSVILIGYFVTNHNCFSLDHPD